jgi:uncharacterized protein (TIGR02466 family)
MNNIIENAVDVVFGCPVFVNDSHSDELEQIQKELEKIIPLLVPNLSDSSNYPWDKGKNGNKLNLNLPINIIAEYNLINLKKYIFECVGKYLNNIGGKECNFQIEHSWLTEMTKGDYMGKHNHGSSHISGVYYYKVDNDGGDFILFPQGAQTIHPFPQMFSAWDKYAPTIHYKPKVGRIIMFPGWTEHCVTECKSDVLRYSIPFNINLRLL